MEEYFAPRSAPEALVQAARDTPKFIRYLKSITGQELAQAKELIHRHHNVHHSIIDEEIVRCQQAEAKERSENSLAQAERHHSERQWWTRFTSWVAFLSALVALGSFLANQFRPPAQVRELSTRVAALEQQLATLTTKPQVSIPPPIVKPSPASSLAPSIAPPSMLPAQPTPVPKQP